MANLQRELNYIRRLQLTPDGSKPGKQTMFALLLATFGCCVPRHTAILILWYICTTNSIISERLELFVTKTLLLSFTARP